MFNLKIYYFSDTFQTGYDDIRFCRDWNEDYDHWAGPDQMDYERGRQFYLEFSDRYQIRDMKSPYDCFPALDHILLSVDKN